MIKQCVRLGHDRFWYTTLTDYYPESIVDFYDILEIDEESRLLSVVYHNNRHLITIELIKDAMNVHCCYTAEQFPMGSQTLQYWVEEIVHGGK